MIALAVGKAKSSLLQDRIQPIPKGDREAGKLPVVGEASQPILTPPIRPAARMIMREIVPCCAVVAVILTNRAPLPLAGVGTLLTPSLSTFPYLSQPGMLALLFFKH